MTKNEMNQTVGSPPFMGLQGLGKLLRFGVFSLFILFSFLFYFMGDKLRDGVSKLPEHAKTSARELKVESLTEQDDLIGFLTRELLFISVYQLKTEEKSIDVFVDVIRIDDFLEQARNGNLRLEFLEGRERGFFPDVLSVKIRMEETSASPWRGRLFGTIAFITNVFGTSQKPRDHHKDLSWSMKALLGGILLGCVRFAGTRRRRIFYRNFPVEKKSGLKEASFSMKGSTSLFQREIRELRDPRIPVTYRGPRRIYSISHRDLPKSLMYERYSSIRSSCIGPSLCCWSQL